MWINLSPKPYHMPIPPTRLDSLTDRDSALSALRTRVEKGGGIVKVIMSLERETRSTNEVRWEQGQRVSI